LKYAIFFPLFFVINISVYVADHWNRWGTVILGIPSCLIFLLGIHKVGDTAFAIGDFHVPFYLLAIIIGLAMSILIFLHC